MERELVSVAEVVYYTGYRLSDTVFWLLPVLAVLTCVIHAARRAFRHPAPTEER